MDNLDEQAHFFVHKGIRTVAVQGEAEIETSPDLVTVTLGISEQNDDLKVAQDAIQEKTEQVLDVAKSFDFPAEDVQTQQLSSKKVVEVVGEDGIALPEYGHSFGNFGHVGGEDGEPKVKRRKHEFFKVSLNVTLVVRGQRIDQYNAVMQALLSSGAAIDGESMETTQLGDLRHEARILAVSNAKRKAEALTAGTGVSVGPPVLIREGGARMVSHGYGRTRQTARRSTGGRAPRRQLATVAARRPVDGNEDAEDEEQSTEDLTPKMFQLGSIKVTGEVSIIFELREQ